MTRAIIGIPVTALGAGLLYTGHEYTGWLALVAGLLILLGELAVDLLGSVGPFSDE